MCRCAIEQATIRQTLSAMADPQVRVLLFSWRTDDPAKGGNRDLLVDLAAPH
jgi:hypothetical protein